MGGGVQAGVGVRVVLWAVYVIMLVLGLWAAYVGVRAAGRRGSGLLANGSAVWCHQAGLLSHLAVMRTSHMPCLPVALSQCTHPVSITHTYASHPVGINPALPSLSSSNFTHTQAGTHASARALTHTLFLCRSVQPGKRSSYHTSTQAGHPHCTPQAQVHTQTQTKRVSHGRGT